METLELKTLISKIENSLNKLQSILNIRKRAVDLKAG